MIKRMRNILLIALIVVLTVSCNKKKMTLTGELSNIENGTWLYYDNGVTKDSFCVLNGKFKWEHTFTKPQLIFISNNNYTNFRYTCFWAENSDIKIKGDYNQFRNIIITGSKSQDEENEYNKLIKTVRQINDSLIGVLKKNSGNLEAEIFLRKKIKQNKNKVKQFYLERNDSYTMLDLLNSQRFIKDLSKKDIKEVFHNLSPALKNTETANACITYANLPEPHKIGDYFMDFQQSDTSGRPIKLSDFKGKIIILEFWSTHCGPCVQEIPYLKEVYKKYQPLGLEIIGIAEQSIKQEWIQFINDKEIDWIQLSDLNGKHNKVSMLYEAYSKPTKIFINREGIITNRTEGNGNIDSILEELFSKD